MSDKKVFQLNGHYVSVEERINAFESQGYVLLSTYTEGKGVYGVFDESNVANIAWPGNVERKSVETPDT